MYEAQRFVDSQENANFGDPKSWLSGEDHNSSPTHRLTQSSLANSTTTAPAGQSGSLVRVLYQDLVEIVPLVQSLIDRKPSSSFTRRGSVIYTKTPSRDSLSKKVTESKGRTAAQSIPTKKRRDPGDKDQGKNTSNNSDADNYSVVSSRALAAEKDREELVMLKEQLEDLRIKLSEKDELLKSAEISKNQVNAVQAKLDELRHQASEKDSLIKSTQLQLSDAKIKLADKQATLEKIQWEAMTSNRKVEKLQQELDCMQGEISSFMLLFEGLTKSDSAVYADDYDLTAKYLDCLPCTDDLDEKEMQRMDEARKAYIAAVATAKERQDEESVTAAARARLHLQSFVLKT
ncbi:protein MICROTUBULE BINDING PROTEIN 2C isoform X2 [Alnus glutinosa]|uniref:protein MICROTUBULE BINDING PROTEIN 2C isoform X2 n=1 Tax=Alnus glutinosa TaxID=3517 RepID=UPI002D769B66|nr:protein MICROTUBULE BINDING PROTEIN 2C isoform X2 [Alnus glutinosa]